MRLQKPSLLILLACSGTGIACAVVRAPETRVPDRSESIRYDAIARAQVWTRTNIPSMNVRVGHGGPGAFAPGATVPCTYLG